MKYISYDNKIFSDRSACIEWESSNINRECSVLDSNKVRLYLFDNVICSTSDGLREGQIIGFYYYNDDDNDSTSLIIVIENKGVKHRIAADTLVAGKTYKTQKVMKHENKQTAFVQY